MDQTAAGEVNGMPANSNEYDRQYRAKRKEKAKLAQVLAQGLALKMQEEIENLRKFLRKESPKVSPKVPPHPPNNPFLTPTPFPLLASLSSCIPPRGKNEKGAAKGANRGARLSPDWSPSLGGRSFCSEAGLDPDETFAAFRDYWLAKPSDAAKLDWEATWRNWCRKAKQDNRPGRTSRDAAHERRARGEEALMRAVLARTPR
jgi:hypothetical protein